MERISAFIIAKNESARIEKAINSIKNIVDEIVVIDSGSTDDTVIIAENLGAKVIFNEWKGYVQQKSFGEKLCKHDWILNIDADEELTTKLQDEITQKFSSVNCNAYKAYKIDIITLHRNDTKVRLLAPVKSFIRIYNRNFCSFSNTTNTTTHDSVTFNQDMDDASPVTGKFRNPIIHRSVVSIEQFVNKANFYSTEQAKDMEKLGRSPSMLRIVCELPLYFLKTFFMRRYFVFGFDGFVDSIIFAFSRFLRLAKARENENKKKLEQINLPNR